MIECADQVPAGYTGARKRRPSVELAKILATSLEIPLTLSGPPAEQVLAYLRRRTVLPILDNCEQLAGGLNWLSELLGQEPGLKILATSRERLHLAGEWVYVVPELAQSEELFVETAKRVKQEFDVEGGRSGPGAPHGIDAGPSGGGDHG